MRNLKGYINYVNENMDMAKSIISKKMDAFEKLKTLLSKNIGYIGKFTDYLYNENIPYTELEELYKSILDLKSKNVSIDISKLKYEKVLDLIQSEKEKLIVNSFISMFPSKQKESARKLLRSNFSLFLKVASKPNIDAFISKVSRYKTEDDLLDAIKIFSKDSSDDREKVKETISKLKSTVVFEDSDILVVYVPIQDDIKVLGSNTSWCIVSSSSLWTNYTKGRFQFILYDYSTDEYDPKFKIGFTLTDTGNIHAAHDILDSGASTHLINKLEEHNVDKIELIKKVISSSKGLSIDQVRANTSIDNITNLISITLGEDNLSKLLIKLFDIYKWDGKEYLKDISYNRKELVNKTFKKLFADKPYITKEMCDKYDSRVYGFCMKNQNNKVLDKDKINLNLPNDVLIKAIDMWTDDAIKNGMNSFYGSDIFNGTIKDYANLEDKDLRYSKDFLNKLSDRINNIYSKDKNLQQSFINKMLILNAILGKKYDKSLVDSRFSSSYPGLFSKQIDLDKSDFSLTWRSTSFPIEYIIKKDYKEPIYVDLNGFNKKYSEFVEYLKDYKLRFYVKKDEINRILNRTSLDENETKFVNLLRSIKRVGVEKSDGNISITTRP